MMSRVGSDSNQKTFQTSGILVSFPRDREPHILERENICVPSSPLNIQAYSLDKGIIDIRWTAPEEIQSNTRFNIIGINIYRSFDSEYGPFIRLNTVPIGTRFWRDQIRTVLSLQEDVSNSFMSRGPETGPDGRYIICVANKPIVIYPSPGVANCTNLNVQVTINGVNAYVQSIDSVRGYVELRTLPYFDVASQQKLPAILPTSNSDVVLATYKYLTNQISTELVARAFYRVTTVAYDDVAAKLIETPLEKAAQTNYQEIEKLDWIWREAVRRNRWVLNQGGERVKVFIRKFNGYRCGCYSPEHKRAKSDCAVCYGVGIIGGYEGPFDVMIAPDDGEKSISRTNRGATVSHSYDTWTGPHPLLSQRDFIVKMNGDRYGIGPVRMPSNRGMQLQQFFSVSSFDEADIRFSIYVPNPNYLEAPETRYMIPGRGDATPMMTEKANIPDERELRGGTVTWENNNY